MGCLSALAKDASCGQLPSATLAMFLPALRAWPPAAGLSDVDGVTSLGKPGSGRVRQAGVPCGRGELAAFSLGGGKASR